MKVTRSLYLKWIPFLLNTLSSWRKSVMSIFADLLEIKLLSSRISTTFCLNSLKSSNSSSSCISSSFSSSSPSTSSTSSSSSTNLISSSSSLISSCSFSSNFCNRSSHFCFLLFFLLEAMKRNKYIYLHFASWKALMTSSSISIIFEKSAICSSSGSSFSSSSLGCNALTIL